MEVDDETVAVREYDEGRDNYAVEMLERKCEVGKRGESSLVTDLLGDPLCRIRYFPARTMMVAEYGKEREIVGVVRGGVKSVTSGERGGKSPIYVKVAYVLGLRVSPTHRRYGIGTLLVNKLEEWCRKEGANYVYTATDGNNEASIKLFTLKCNYTKFRSLSVLVQPVHAHHNLVSPDVGIVQLPLHVAISVYREVFHSSEFFPEDIDSILSSEPNLGTFVAVPKKYLGDWDPLEWRDKPPSFAILSVWDTKKVYKMQLQGASKLTRACCLGTRVLDTYLPWLRVPSIPNFFEPFGYYFLFGLHMEGEDGVSLMRSLCHMAHNMAKDDVECGAVAAEMAMWDPVREAIPHWKRFSWEEDLWCIKKFDDDTNLYEERRELSDWTTSPTPYSKVFVDPRDL